MNSKTSFYFLGHLDSHCNSHSTQENYSQILIRFNYCVTFPKNPSVAGQFSPFVRPRCFHFLTSYWSKKGQLDNTRQSQLFQCATSPVQIQCGHFMISVKHNFISKLTARQPNHYMTYIQYVCSLEVYLGSPKVCLLSLVWPGPYILERSSSISFDDLERNKNGCWKTSTCIIFNQQ